MKHIISALLKTVPRFSKSGVRQQTNFSRKLLHSPQPFNKIFLKKRIPPRKAESASTIFCTVRNFEFQFGMVYVASVRSSSSNSGERSAGRSKRSALSKKMFTMKSNSVMHLYHLLAQRRLLTAKLRRSEDEMSVLCDGGVLIMFKLTAVYNTRYYLHFNADHIHY